LTIVAAVAVLIATLVLPVLQIEGTSMEPTLSNGDIVLLTKNTRFERGELCGFTWNNKLLIKRVIGLPGEILEIRDDGIYIDGVLYDDPQLDERERKLLFISAGKWQIPEGHYFVMGDNRADSLDSRTARVGFVPRENILGRAAARIWPPEKWQSLD
jgi:signal peptidase I